MAGGSRQQIHGGCGKTPARVWQEGHKADPPHPKGTGLCCPLRWELPPAKSPRSHRGPPDTAPGEHRL